MSITLIGGGSRSGKSSHALRVARQYGGRLAFIATAQAFDEEMRERIAKHREERDAAFTTIEEPFDLAGTLAAAEFDTVVVDCLTLWLSNHMLRDEASVEGHVAEFMSIAQALPARIILVTNEVGCGIVPDNALARRFRDHAGRLNQLAAAAADEVYWMIFGCPLRVVEKQSPGAMPKD